MRVLEISSIIEFKFKYEKLQVTRQVKGQSITELYSNLGCIDYYI